MQKKLSEDCIKLTKENTEDEKIQMYYNIKSTIEEYKILLEQNDILNLKYNKLNNSFFKFN